jgi:hypothetical protein
MTDVPAPAPAHAPRRHAPHGPVRHRGGEVMEALTVWRESCERSRRTVTTVPSSNDSNGTGVRRRTGEPVPLRRVLIDMATEYARRTGHAGPLRNSTGGATGR